MAYAHARGVIHRDLKPENVVLGDYGETVIVDWGLAKVLEPEQRPSEADRTPDARAPERAEPADGDPAATRAGAVLGTPAYMAPEQAAGDLAKIGPHTDVYALGAMLYELLVGRAPFMGSTSDEVLARVLRGPPPPARAIRREVPRPLAAICARAMARPIGERYPSADALVSDLERFQADEPVEAYREPATARAARWLRRRRPVAYAVAIALVVVSILAVVSSIWIGRERRAAVRAAEVARRERARAIRALADAETNLYLASVRLAATEWRRNAPERANELLEDCPARLRGWEWRYLAGALGACRLTIEVPPEARQIAWSPDGTRIAAVVGARVSTRYGFLVDRFALGEVRVYDAATGRELRRFGGRAAVHHLAFSPRGDELWTAGGSPDNTRGEVRRWELSTGRLLATLESAGGNALHVTVTPDGARVLGVGPRGATVWSTGTEEVIARFAPDAGLPGATRAFAALTRSGDRALVRGFERSRVWQLDVAAPGELLPSQLGRVRAAAFRPDGHALALATETAGRPARVLLWNPSTRKVTWSAAVDVAEPGGLAFTPDGASLLAAGRDGAVHLLNARSGRTRRVLHGHAGGARSVAVRADGGEWASCGEDGRIRIWRADGGEAWRVVAPFGAQSRFALDGAGTRIVTDALRILDAQTGQELARLPGTTGVETLAFGVEGRRVAVARSADPILNPEAASEVRVLDPRSGREVAAFRQHERPVTALGFRPGTSSLASGDQAGHVLWWDGETGRLLGRLGRHAETGVTAIAFPPGGEWIVSGGADGTLRATALPEGAVRWEARGPRGLGCLAVDPRGAQVAAGGDDGEVVLRQARTGVPLRRLRGHAGAVRALAFHPTEPRLASAAADGAVKVWDLDTGREVLTLRASPDGQSLAFSPDGRTLYGVAPDGIVAWQANADDDAPAGPR